MDILSYLVDYNRYLNLVGIVVILAIAVLVSRKRWSIDFKLVGWALGLQVILGLVILKTDVGLRLFEGLAYYIDQLYKCADAGISFVFGNLANADSAWGFVFAIKVLPVIIFFGALMALLFHWGVIQIAVGALNMCFRPFLGTSGAETLCAAANSFLGQTEAPLLIRNYLAGLTKSEMLVVMVAGMSTLSVALLAVYASMGIPAQHLLASSIMAVPCSIMIAKIIYPETEESATKGKVKVVYEKKSTNIFDAAFSGTSDGLSLALNVGAMLISFLALLALLNGCLGWLSYLMNALFVLVGVGWQMPELSINLIFSYICSPFAYLLGLTGAEAQAAGQLIGKKIALNELLAYSDLSGMLKSGVMSERTTSILTYALCGFSNFSSIGIQIGGIGALVPEKRHWLSELGLYAVLGGALANLFTAMLASLLI